MNNVYDNGALMLGNIENVIKAVEREIKKDIDMCCIDARDLLKDLIQLKSVDSSMIVCINYENGMGYTIDYWRKNDIVKLKDRSNNNE